MQQTRFLWQALLISVCLFSLSVKAQQNFDTIFHRSTYVELPYSIQQSSDSCYVFITSGDDYPNNTYWIEFNKLNKNGTIAFQKLFGYLGSQCYVGFSGSLKPTFDGGWIYGGSIASVSGNGVMAVKYNAIGDTEFVKFFGDTAQNTFYDCIQSSDSGYVFVGDHAKYSPGINNDFFIVKTDVLGNLLWQRTLGTSVDEQAFHVIENSNHQLVITGAKADFNNWHHPYMVMYDLQGNLIKTKDFNQGALNSGGGGLVSNYDLKDYTLNATLDTIINANDHANPQYIAKLDSSFNIQWKTIYNSSDGKGAAVNRELSDGGIAMVGFKYNSLNHNYPIGWIAKMDSSGNKLWEHFYKGLNADICYFTDFQETFDHGFIICGMSIDSINYNQESWIVKLDSNGCLDGSCGINTGTHEIFYNSQLAVFPNPVHDLLHINTDENSGEITLFDLMGKEVILQIADRKKETIIDVSNLVEGMYVIRFTSGKKVFTSKMLKE